MEGTVKAQAETIHKMRGMAALRNLSLEMTLLCSYNVLQHVQSYKKW